MRSPIVLALALLLIGCGIDRGGAPDMPIDPNNIGRASDTLIIGPIGDKSADTLTIDGIVIGVENALIQVDGGTSDLDQLHVGQYAVVRGATSASLTTLASTVAIDTEVIGTATAFDADNNTLSILGQQIVISDNTSLEAALVDAVFSDVEALGPVRVSGIADGLGRIDATYIAREPSAPSRLTGFVAMVDDVNLSFLIGPQAVTYASAMVINLSSPAPRNNTRVALTGDKETAEFTVDTIVDALLIPADLADNASIQLTAAVTLPLTDGSFAAGFVPATLNAAVIFTDGNASDLAPGAIVTVQGVWKDDQRIDVTAVRIVRPQ